jgi:putrescine transport system ATP-binding protein
VARHEAALTPLPRFPAAGAAAGVVLFFFLLAGGAGMAQKSLGPVRRSFAPWRDPGARPLIEFRGITKRFGDFTAVDNVDLAIYEREFFALLGPSGCGKTTLMRMLAGFEQPSAGDILLGGQSLKGIPPYRRPVNMMFQSYALFPHMSVEKNIAFGLTMDKLPKADIAARVEEMLRLVKLEPYAKRKPHQLSGGQRQRVALARSLAKKPKVLLLDEPLGALDKKLREETQFELMDIQMDLGMTFLVVTHDQDEAMTLSDRIAVMDHGRFVQIDTPSTIYEQPTTRYVADFIGDINLIDARVEAVAGGRITLSAPDLGARFVVEDDETPAPGDAVAVAVRPEKMHMRLEAPEAGAANTLAGTVYDIGYLGDWSIYHIKTADGRILRVSVANTERVIARPITWEDPVWLSFAPDAALVLRD